jgi:hypothetical protein
MASPGRAGPGACPVLYLIDKAWAAGGEKLSAVIKPHLAQRGLDPACAHASAGAAALVKQANRMPSRHQLLRRRCPAKARPNDRNTGHLVFLLTDTQTYSANRSGQGRMFIWALLQIFHILRNIHFIKFKSLQPFNV